MLEVLFPAAMGGGAFLVGEAHDHDPATGRPRFSAFKEVNGRYFEGDEVITFAEFKRMVPTAQYHYY